MHTAPDNRPVTDKQVRRDPGGFTAAAATV